MVRPFQITNVKAGSKYIIMYMYKTRQYFTPFTFIWKKSVYWSSFVIWQEESWDKLQNTQALAFELCTNIPAGRSFFANRTNETLWHLLKKGLLRAVRSSVGLSFHVSELVTCLPLLINVDQILNYRGDCMTEGKWRVRGGNGDPSQINWLNA